MYLRIQNSSFWAIADYRLSKEAEKKTADNEKRQHLQSAKTVHAFLEHNPNITLVGEEYDDGYTGTNYERPGFRAILARVHAGEANCVIVKICQDWAENILKLASIWKKFFQSLECVLSP